MTGKDRKTSGRTRTTDRLLKQRVKTARGRKSSSTLWLQRQLNDPYVADAKRMGLRSRAAFKLAEIDDKYALLKPGGLVVDLGAAPGGWSQIAARKVNSAGGDGRVIAVDLSPVEPIAGVDIIEKDFLEDDAPDLILAALAGNKADLVLSDMAAPATGHKRTDHLKIMALAEMAAAFAGDVLKPGGGFLAKVLQGGAEAELLRTLKRDYRNVRHVKPRASRAGSSEIYVLATGFRGGEDQPTG